MGYVIGAIACWSLAVVLSGYAWYQYHQDQLKYERLSDLINYRIPDRENSPNHIDTYL